MHRLGKQPTHPRGQWRDQRALNAVAPRDAGWLRLTGLQCHPASVATVAPSSIPAPTVAFVVSSIRMKEPV